MNSFGQSYGIWMSTTHCRMKLTHSFIHFFFEPTTTNNRLKLFCRSGLREGRLERIKNGILSFFYTATGKPMPLYVRNAKCPDCQHPVGRTMMVCEGECGTYVCMKCYTSFYYVDANGPPIRGHIDTCTGDFSSSSSDSESSYTSSESDEEEQKDS